MHESHFDPPVGKPFHHAQIGSVDVDRIVMGAREKAVFNQQFALAARDLDTVGPGGGGAATCRIGSDGHRIKGEVFGELIDQPHAMHELKSHMLPGDVSAAPGENAGTIPLGITYLINSLRFHVMLSTGTNHEWFNFFQRHSF